MAVRLKDKSISRNAGWSLQLTLYRDRACTQPFDLTGYAVKGQLRMAESTGSALLADLSIAIADDPTAGVVTLELTRAKIAEISAGCGYADLLLIPAGGEPRRLCCWKMTIEDGVTVWT